MGTPYRRPNWLSRQTKAHRTLFVVGLLCAALVLVEIGAVTDFFGLGHRPASSGPAPPNLNPYSEEILAIDTAITGSGSTYFATFEGQNLCEGICPELPTVYTDHDPAQIAIFFYYNVTNSAGTTETLTAPTLGTSGLNATMFTVQTFCCYSTNSTPYKELINSALIFTPGLTVGLRGYAYTIEPIPFTTAAGYTFYLNATAS
jgi:hypothetical protein